MGHAGRGSRGRRGNSRSSWPHDQHARGDMYEGLGAGEQALGQEEGRGAGEQALASCAAACSVSAASFATCDGMQHGRRGLAMMTMMKGCRAAGAPSQGPKVMQGPHRSPYCSCDRSPYCSCDRSRHLGPTYGSNAPQGREGATPVGS